LGLDKPELEEAVPELLLAPTGVVVSDILTVSPSIWHTCIKVAVVHPLPVEEKVWAIGIHPDLWVVLVVVHAKLSGV
jgi:hypothetical protein